MEEQQKNSTSEQDKVRFRIPKKKPDSWNEEVKLTSPLSRCSSPNLQNSPSQEKRWSSSYSEYNKTRNHDSFSYYHNNRGLNRHSPHPSNFPDRNELHKRLDSSCLQISLRPREQSRKSALSPERRCNQELEGDQKSSPLKRSKKDLDSSSYELEEAKELDSVTRKGRCSGPYAEECRPFSFEKATPPSDESRDSNLTSPSSTSSPQNNRCLRKNCSSPAQRQENTLQPLEADYKERIFDCNMDLPFACIKRPGLDNSSKAPNNVSTENKLKSSASISTDKLKTREKVLNLNRYRDRSSRKKLLTNEVEPIILSSDEEDETSLDSENTEVLLHQTVKDRLTDIREMELNSKSALSDRHTSEEGEKKTVEQTLGHDEQLYSNTVGLTSSHSEERSSPVLEIDFKTVYIGRNKGRSRGLVKFSTTTIEIPFYETTRNTQTLSVNSRYLRKCGLWMNISAWSMTRNSFIFLWIAEDHASEILNKFRFPPSSLPMQASEFLFLELCKPLKDQEQEILCELIREWGMKNRQPELSDLLSWEEATPLLKDLPKDECSFLANNVTYFHKEQEKSTVADPKHKPEESNVSISKPSYTVLRKCSLIKCAVSLIPKPDGEWKEIKAKGSVQRLIVYPPPPTKGGLGVTQEDLECLEHGEFLNDVIIDFYLKYLLLEKVPQHLAERSHIFSSFFFRCLTRAEHTLADENPDTSAAQRRHHRVKTWTRHADIFKKDFIFVPVNEESHWYLAVICFPWLEKAVYEERTKSTALQHQIEAKEQEDPSRKSTVIVFNDTCSRKEEMGGDSSPQSEGDYQHTSVAVSAAPKISKGTLEKQSGKTKICKRPCILIFDSLKASSVQNTVQVLRDYLEVEWNVKRKSSREFSRSNMRDFYPRVPKQDNSSDCGVYLLQYVESFFKTPIVSFEPPMHMEHWFPRYVVRSKREEIRDLILRLHLQQTRGYSS